MNDWSRPQRPAEYAEKSLIIEILNGNYPPGTALPAEREMAVKLGITRPTLREALQRLGRDGWITIQQGKPTRVNDYWENGGLNVLNSLVQYSEKLPPSFIPNLLQMRLILAPAYARQAVENAPEQVVDRLRDHREIDDTPECYATYDWQLHHTLTIASGNPIFTLILNGFAGFYEQMARIYFQEANSRQSSQEFYRQLYRSAEMKDADRAEEVTRLVMLESIQQWEAAQEGER